jgi:hypothetical protein
VTLEYFLHNAGKDFACYEERGTITAPGIVCAAWRFRTERAAVFLVNLLPESYDLRLELDPGEFGLAHEGPFQAWRLDRDGAQPLGRQDGPTALQVTLPPRRVVAVELLPVSLEATRP